MITDNQGSLHKLIELSKWMPIKMSRCIYIILCFLHLSAVNGFNSYNHELVDILVPKVNSNQQEDAVRRLIIRSVGNIYAQKFVVSVNSSLTSRTFQLKTLDNVVHLTASDGISAARGFYHYVKYALLKDITWNNIKVKIPPDVPLPYINYNSTSASLFLYYQNVCTWSYSFVWWEFLEWEKHIDWMAMMGISMTIAPIQEQIWFDIYKEMGLSENHINEHFAGVAFQAWQRMGNIRNWAGPLPATYRAMQMNLQKRILLRQRAFGMIVAIPAFAGHVPIALQELYPKIAFSKVPRWNNFPDKYCCGLFLDPNEALFKEIGQKFLQRAINAYGTNHLYFCDPFNENQPSSPSPSYLKRTAQNIYDTMHSVDEQSIWLLQGWMFVKNIFWTDEMIKSFLMAVPNGHLLVLDLQSEQFPQYERTLSYYGQPFIWCMLHNFGGTLGMFGSADIVNQRITLAREMENSTIIGVGITPEGIYQNYILYALCLERGWAKNPFNLNDWFAHFATVRYGVRNEDIRQAWLLLKSTVYSYHGLEKMRGKYTITRRPSLSLRPWTWYNQTLVQEAWRLFLRANASIPNCPNYRDAYEYDVVDLTRQVLQNLADRIYVNIISSYKKRQVDRFNYLSKILLGVFDDLELILASNEQFLLGRWIHMAKSWAQTKAEELLYEFNARNQITTWGPNGQILDYATKQWSGIVVDYYKPRWALFLSMIETSFRNNSSFDNNHFKRIVSKKIEIPFSYRVHPYPVHKIGSTLIIATCIYENWTSILESKSFMHMARRNVHKRK